MLDKQTTRVRFPTGTRGFCLLYSVKMDAGVQSTSCLIGTRGSFLRNEEADAIYLHLVLTVRLGRAITPFPIHRGGVVLSDVQVQV
jgi:hypothetical protein